MIEARVEALLRAIKAGKQDEVVEAAKKFDTSGELAIMPITADDKRFAASLLDHIAEQRRQVTSVESLELLGKLKNILGVRDAKPVVYVAKLRARMRRFSFDQIEQAAKNIAANKFMMGEDDGEKKASMEYLLRNDLQVDKWLTKTNSNGSMRREEMRKIFRSNGAAQ